MNIKKSLLFMALAVTTALLGFVKFDDDILKKITYQLEKWAVEYPQEKVYLHLDKPYYAVGDNIWFKAYITVGGAHRLSAMSGILNVELINEKDSIKRAIKLPVTSGFAWGDFKLPDSLAEGNYRIRAYTNYMRNAGEEYFFDKTIAIGNAIGNNVFVKTTYTFSTQNGKQKVDADIHYTDLDGNPYDGKEVIYDVQLNFRSLAHGKATTDQDGDIHVSFINQVPAVFKSGFIVTKIKLSQTQTATKTLVVKSTSTKADLQFFPESGSFVNGLRNKIAFKALGGDGLGVDVSGIVVDNDNQEVAKLTSQHLGMGVFALIPQAGKTYSAKITYADGSEGVFALPKATDQGYLLTVNNNDANDVIIKVSISDATFAASQNSTINIVAQCGSKIVYAAKTKIEAQVFSAHVARSRFPSGIVQFTLFTETGEPLNERIACIQNPDALNLSLSTEKKIYKPREKVKMDVTDQGVAGNISVGSFSVAVIDESKVPVDEDTESTILINILLTSDLKGYIEKPNYYFTNVTEKTRADLDVLMLTQGYRRFLWKQIIADSFAPLVYQPEKSLQVSGRITNLSGKAIANGKVMLLTTTGGTFVLDTVSDEQGRFAFKNLIFGDSIKFVVQARTAKDRKNVEIELDNIPAQSVTKNKNSADVSVNVSSSLLYYLKNSKLQYDNLVRYGIITQSHMLNAVTITDKKQSLKNSSNLNGAGAADQVISGDQLQSCATIIQCLQSRAAFITFRGNVPYSNRSPNIPMGLVVDGMTMDVSYLDAINPSDIETVEVLRSMSYTAIYGSNGAGGLLLITTRRGAPNYTSRYAPGIVTYNPLGYYKAREFYSPQYDDPKTNVKVADLRSTIYWKPNIVTDKTGKASFSFFNADTKGTYRAVIEGIDGEGNIGRSIYRYKVE